MIEPSLRTKLDHHLVTAQARLYRSVAGGLFEVTPQWVRGYSGLQVPTFNIFMPLTHDGLTDETLADTAAFFYSRDVFYVVELVHDRFPHGPDYLNERRYQPLPPQPAMCLAGAPTIAQLNPAITIERVSTVPGLTAICSLLHWVFDFPLHDVAKLYSAIQLKDENKNTIRHYLAFINDTPIGAGTMICLNGVVSIWNLCTLDEYRRQGVATALLDRMLNDAAASGSNLTMAYSTPLAFHLFNKLGFDLYAQRQWFLPPEVDFGEEE